MRIREHIERWTGVASLRESLRQERDTARLLDESLRSLELAMEDEGWQAMGRDGKREFSREGLRQIAALSRIMFLKNPLVNRAVLVQAMYVWAQGVSISSEDEATQAVITAFLDDPANQAELTSHQARTMKECDLQVLGNLFFALFTDINTGGVKVRTVPVDEITEIITDPEDRKAVWFYKREWTAASLDIGTGTTTNKPQVAYYPDIQHTPDEQVPTIGGNPVVWDTPVYHVRVGGLSDMQFGVPETYAALDWAKAVKDNLEDWATVVRSYARFAWNLNTTGGAKAVATAKARLGTGRTTSSVDTNPPPTPGGVFVGSGAEMTPIKTSGATTSPEDGRYLRLMVCAAFGLPETFFGDVSTGNLATAKSLDRPTELKFIDRQQLWKSVLNTILQYAVRRSKQAPSGAMRIKTSGEANAKITIEFPPILEHDITETIGAIVSAATLDGKTTASTVDWKTTTRLLLTALKVSDIDGVLAVLELEREDEQARRDEMASAMADRAVVAPQVAEAARALREAVERFGRAA